MPIVKDIEPPPELYEIEPTKIVGLTIGAEIGSPRSRTARVRHMGAPNRRYSELNGIYDELAHASTGGWAAR